MPSLIKQHERWYLQFYSSDRKPRQVRVPLQTSRKKTARRHRRRLEEAYAAGEFDPWVDDARTFQRKDRSGFTVKEAFDRFIEQKRQDGRSQNTIRTYQEVVGLLMEEIDPETPLNSISSNVVDTFMKAPTLSKATQHKRFRHLRSFFRWCEKKEYTAKNPMEHLSAPSRPEKLPKAVTEDDLDRICAALEADYEEKLSKGHCREGSMIWRIPLFRFAYYTGMRSIELARLRWDDIDFDDRLVYIRQQKNNREQTIPLNGKAREILEDIREGQATGYVFVSPTFDGDERSAQSEAWRMSRAFKEAREKAGIERDVSFHGLRHGFCTKLAQAGKPAYIIRDAARHADISTSMAYIHMVREHLKNELDDVFG